MIFVESEFATLKRVVLTESEFGYPLDPRAEDLRFLNEGAVQENFDHRGKDYREAFPTLQKEWEAERTAFRQILEKYGVEVLQPRKLRVEEKKYAPTDGYSNFFIRDPFFTIGDYVIEGSIRFLHRRHEIFPVRQLFLENVYPQDCIYVAAPKPEIAVMGDKTLGPGPFLEGGDVMVLGKNVFVGHSGLASNQLGIQWLSKLLSPRGYHVEAIRLHPDILHLDCAMGLVKPGLMVICEEAFLDGTPKIFDDWKRITVAFEETRMLATNGLPLSPEVYVTDPVFAHIGKQIEQEGVVVEYIDYKISRSFGGAFRCSTQPLLRID